MKSVLSESCDTERLFSVAVLLAQASVPQEVLSALRMGRLTTLQKPNGSVRGIVASDVQKTCRENHGAAVGSSD